MRRISRLVSTFLPLPRFYGWVQHGITILLLRGEHIPGLGLRIYTQNPPMR